MHTPTRLTARLPLIALAFAGSLLLALAPTAAASHSDCTSLGTCVSITLWYNVSNCTPYFCVVEFHHYADGSSSLSVPGNVWERDSSGGSLFCFWTTLPSSCRTPTQTNGFIISRGSSVTLDVWADACAGGLGTLNLGLDCAHAHTSRTVYV